MTLIYLADLAHSHSVEDHSLTVPLGLGYIKAYAKVAFGEAVEIRLCKVLGDGRGLTLSKVLKTQGIGLPDLKLTLPERYGFDDSFRRAV